MFLFYGKNKSENREIALIKAAKKGQSYTVRALLEVGVDVNAENRRGWTALMMATWKGHTEIANLLKLATLEQAGII